MGGEGREGELEAEFERERRGEAGAARVGEETTERAKRPKRVLGAVGRIAGFLLFE
jgi:hypothetical protein